MLSGITSTISIGREVQTWMPRGFYRVGPDIESLLRRILVAGATPVKVNFSYWRATRPFTEDSQCLIGWQEDPTSRL